MFSWFWGVLNRLGLAYKKGRIVFLGLDNAGKTTLLNVLKDDRLSMHVPTVHPHSEELVIEGINFQTFDLGGHETARRIWKDYLATVDGIIFVVDAADRTRFEEAAEELNLLLASDELVKTPICVLGNKIDKPNAASEQELRASLGLPEHLTYGKDYKSRSATRPVELFMCSVSRRMGYNDGFKWLSRFL
uniref:small monomeric GTPase n=1 Tax=Dermatophagoides pteronyssinus TaxID=6956 RepID=A0A6P6YKV9_DERPT|nr:GTP-binding protein SAR1-like [Dermatophagoides pteronyssinus]